MLTENVLVDYDCGSGRAALFLSSTAASTVEDEGMHVFEWWGGEIIHNYRRISKGWKKYRKTDSHYCEGDDTGTFHLHGKDLKLALCGDLWEFPERFRTTHLLIWPVYVNFTLEEWNHGALDEYAAQAFLAASEVLMINPIDNEQENHGGSFHFRNGQTIAKLPFDQEGILIVEIL